MLKARLVLLMVVGTALLFPRDAFAYLDPGSGSLIFQALVAMLAGVAYGVRVYWAKLRGLFSRAVKPSQAQTKLDSDVTTKP